MSSGVVDEGRWRGGTLDPPPAGWMHAVCLAAQVPKAAVAVVDSAGLRWAQVGGDVDDSVMNELGEGVVVGDVAGAAAGGAAPETAVFEACSLSKAPFVLAVASLAMDGTLSLDERLGPMLGRGSHSSTSQLNLSRVWHKKTPYTP